MGRGTAHQTAMMGMTSSKKHPSNNSSLPQTALSNTAPSTSIRAASRKNRVYVFREFIMTLYEQYLQEGDVVLDIAGGKGDLSWLLSNVDQLHSVVVDPRLTKTHIVKSVQWLREHPDQARERAIPHLPTYQPLAALLPTLEGTDTFVSPKHLRILVDQHLIEAVRKYQQTGSMEEWKTYWERAMTIGREVQTLGYEESFTNDGCEIQSADVALQTILKTKLILGFHPDQATDPALDLALALRIPYCIVPCCVFPKEFPTRRTASQGSVRTYSDLVDYLRNKCSQSGLQEAFLPFHFTETAKNLALYSVKSHSNENSETREDVGSE